VTAAAGESQARRRQQQSHDEAVAGALDTLALLIASALFRPAFAVAGAESVFGLQSLLAAVGLIENENPAAVALGLGLKQEIGDGLEDGPVLRPVQAGEEAGQLGAVSSLGADGSGSLGG